MNELINLDTIEESKFDYTQLDNGTAEELQDIAVSIGAINSNLKYLIGEQLAKAQELLSKNGYGCFGEWIEAHNLKSTTAKNIINYYKVISQNLTEQEKLKQLPFSKVHELAKLEPEVQKKIIDSRALEEKTAKEVQELTRKLKAEQEYTDELQEAIREKETLINELKLQETKIVEKIVEKEVIPEAVSNQVEQQEKELKELKAKLEKAESVIRTTRLETAVEKDHLYDSVNLDGLLLNVKEFLDKVSKYTYLKEQLQNIPTKKKKFIEKSVSAIEDWTVLMKQALDDREDVVGDVIYGEGEIINE